MSKGRREERREGKRERDRTDGENDREKSFLQLTHVIGTSSSIQGHYTILLITEQKHLSPFCLKSAKRLIKSGHSQTADSNGCPFHTLVPSGVSRHAAQIRIIKRREVAQRHLLPNLTI